MSILEIILLLVLVVAVAAIVSFLFQNGKQDKQTQSEKFSEYTKEELDNIRLAEELYNKDLRPVVVRQPKPKTVKTGQVKDTSVSSEFPIDKPKKRRKYYPKTKK